VNASQQRLVIGIDASRNRSGGAREHLIGILENLDADALDISHVHIWSYQKLLLALPERPWLIKHAVLALEGGLLRQLWWQLSALSSALKRYGCHILFTTDASSLCRFSPSVVLSQDLLSYEPGVMTKFGWSRARLRLILIRWVQNAAFRRATGVIFLTQYAANLIQTASGSLPNIQVIAHGVHPRFFKRNEGLHSRQTILSKRAIHCLYISNAALYKYQWVVIEAIGILRKKGLNIQLSLVGGGSGLAQKKVLNQVALTDPDGQFVAQYPFLPHDELINHMDSADIFIFASGCEAFGITLLEAMARGLPVASSNRSSISETLADGGVYFDPESPEEIAAIIEELIADPVLRGKLSKRALELASLYSWGKCSRQTWGFIVDTYRKDASNGTVA
jgi:glycosyltransferase involved in cell wall biosynthesis